MTDKYTALLAKLKEAPVDYDQIARDVVQKLARLDCPDRSHQKGE